MFIAELSPPFMLFENIADIAAAVNMLQMQIQFNNAPNAREILIGQRIEHIS